MKKKPTPDIKPFEHTCYVCGEPYKPGTRHCSSCGAELLRECPTCGASNPLDVRQCPACGQELDAVDAMFTRLTITTDDKLRRARQRGVRVKAEEEEASQARLAEMWAEEDRRLEALAQARAERDRQERFMIITSIVLASIVVLAIVIIAIVVTSSTPSPYF